MTNQLSAEEIEQIRRGVTSAVRSGTVGAAAEDQASLAKYLASAKAGADCTDQLVRAAIDAARHGGLSWAQVGDVLGVSKQAVQQRYVPSPTEDVGPEQRVIKPLTSFTEMAALEQAGREGWHSVGFGWMSHTVQRSDQQWEHRREGFPTPGTRNRLEREGWQHVGTLYPWQYYARPLGLAPVSGDGQEL